MIHNVQQNEIPAKNKQTYQLKYKLETLELPNCNETKYKDNIAIEIVK